MKCRKYYREQKYQYGDYLEVNLYPVYYHARAKKRSTKRKPSRACQTRLNQINAERQLARIMAANFTNEDYSMTLTYSPENKPEDIDRAKKDLRNFFDRLNRARKKAGLEPTKYIYSLEVGEKTKRVHFHLVLSGGLKIKEIQKIWGKGYVDKIKALMFDETGLRGLARYFCKQQVSSSASTANCKRYQCSQNCIKPEPKTNDHKYSKKKVKEIASDNENRRMIEALYPGYFCAECESFWNENNGEHYISIMLYKQDADLDIRSINTKRSVKKNDKKQGNNCKAQQKNEKCLY